MSASTPVRSGDITERQRIPKRYLEQVLQHLVRAGILSGKRGPRGGYRLGRDKSQITLGEVVRVVRRLEAETEPNDMSVGSPLDHEVVWPAWEKLRDEMMTQLDTITIEDLCQRARSSRSSITDTSSHGMNRPLVPARNLARNM